MRRLLLYGSGIVGVQLCDFTEKISVEDLLSEVKWIDGTISDDCGKVKSVAKMGSLYLVSNSEKKN